MRTEAALGNLPSIPDRKVNIVDRLTLEGDNRTLL